MRGTLKHHGEQSSAFKMLATAYRTMSLCHSWLAAVLSLPSASAGSRSMDPVEYSNPSPIP